MTVGGIMRPIWYLVFLWCYQLLYCYWLLILKILKLSPWYIDEKWEALSGNDRVYSVQIGLLVTIWDWGSVVWNQRRSRFQSWLPCLGDVWSDIINSSNNNNNNSSSHHSFSAYFTPSSVISALYTLCNLILLITLWAQASLFCNCLGW